MIGTACATDSSDARSLDAQTAVHLNSTVWGDPFALNVSDMAHEEHEYGNSLIGIHGGADPACDFDRMHERMGLPPDEYQRMHDIAESGGADHLLDAPPDEYRRMYEDSGGHEEIEQDRTSNERTDGSDVTGAGNESVDNVPASTSTYTPTATDEFSGEVVQLTGAQTTDIIWDKGNFGGFCYDINGSVGTEMLTIETGTLTGPNVDRTIEVGALSYTTSPFYREYELHRNLGLTVESDHYGGDSGYMTEFWMGERYVTIDGKPNKLAKPLVEFNDTDIKTLSTGESWDLGGGFALTAQQIDLEGEKVWMTIEKNGIELDSEVIGTGSSTLQERVYTYTEDVAGEYDVPIFSCYVSEVFRGTDSNIVRVKYVFLIDNEVLQISTGEYYGNMQVTSVTPTQITLGNWKNLYLSRYASTCQIMGDLTFKTVRNSGAIEFYPHLIRNELPVLSGGGGFVSNHCGWYTWNLYENYTIGWNQVDLKGNKAWIVLCKNGVVVDERILTEEWWAPIDSDCRYSYVRDGIEIITATLKAAFRGCNLNMIELGEVCQRSEVGGSILINNESHLLPTATEPTGISWNLSDNYMLTVPDLGLDGDDVRLQLSKNGVVVKEKILNEDHANTFAYTSGVGGVNCVVDRVFRGCKANAVKLVNVDQYSDASGTALIVGGSHFYKTGDPEGMPWELPGGYVLTMKDLDFRGDEVWLELSKDDIVLKDDILDSGDLFEYRNGLESFDCVVEAVLRGTLVDVVKLKNVNQYSSTGAQLMDDESKTYTTAELVGLEMWELYEGYSLTAKDIDVEGDEVWLSLFKDGVSVKDAIVDTNGDRWFMYYNATGALIFRAYVDCVFRGTDTNVVQLMYVSLYSEIDGSVLIMFEEDDKKTLSAGGSIPHIPETLTVDASGGADYTSIQVAIDAAESGDTIIVHNGTYHENVRVNKQLTLIGIDMPVVDGGWNDSTIEVTADHCTIEGFRVIHGSSYGIHLRSSASSTLRNTEMSDNTYNLYVSAWSLTDYIHDIDTSNTVNGKPVYYLVGKSGMVIDSSTNPGYVGIVNSSNIVVRDLAMENDYQGILFAYTSSSRIENVNVSDNYYGIYIYQSSSNTLTNNHMTDNSYGMYMSESSNNVISANNASYNRWYGIYMYSSSYNSLTNNIAADNYCCGIYVYGYEDVHYNNYIYTSNTVNGKPVYYYYGLNNQIIQNLETTHLTVAGSTNVVIVNNNISGGDGIHLARSDDSSIRNNVISDNYYGISLHSSNDTITGNTISDNCYGIYVSGYSSNQIQNNVLNSNRYYGVYLSGTYSNTMSGNTISDSNYGNGICMWYSSTNTLTGNAITTQNRGLWVDGYQDDHFNNAIDTSNTVNEKPVYYYYNIHSQTIRDLDASHLTVAYSSDVTITENNVSGGDGIRLAYTSDSTVSANTVDSNVWYGMYLDKAYRNEFTDNTISNNDAGVYVDRSSENEFTDNLVSSNRGNGVSLSYSQSNELTSNTISNNDDSGVYLSDSQSNVLSDNELYSNRYGIQFYDSQYNTIRHNSILGSGYYGICLYDLSSDNRLYHNNLLYNTYTNAYDCGSNHWYNETTGNYWDDYTGADADGNGIGDTPYNISGGSNQDPYPLIAPYDWEMPEPKTIYVDDDFVDDPANHRWNTINEGLADAFHNDTIIVYNGTYTEYVRLNMPTRLIGIGMPVVNRSSIEISAGRCTLDGFRVISGGIRVYSDGNTISNNTVSGDYCGISLSSSSNNTLRNNAMMNFEVTGHSLSDYTHDIDTSNTVDGKPVYYLVNAENQVVNSTSDAGYVAAINSSDITVRDLTLRNSSQGVLFYYTNDSRIENVDVSDSGCGIMLGDSHGNYVANNTINSTGEVALYLYASGNNTLRNNTINSNYLGLLVIGYTRESYDNSIDTSNTLNEKPIHYYYDLHDATIQGLDTTHLTVACSDNVTIRNNSIRDGDIVFLPFLNDSTIMGNTVQDDYLGIYLWTYSRNNTLYHNNLINNTGGNAYDEGIYNQWDSGSAGNYWSDYAGNDTDHNGIGDAPYDIPGGTSIDRYPLMQPWTGGTQLLGDLNGDNHITAADAAIALRLAASGAHDGAADVSGDGSVTSLDALMILQAAVGNVKI